MSVTKVSLDNTSHPGRPGLDELVPSRYALKVGEIEGDGGQRWSAIAARRDVGPQRRRYRPGGLAGGQFPPTGRARVGAECGRGAERRPDHTSTLGSARTRT
jgi:hypothetical protein